MLAASDISKLRELLQQMHGKCPSTHNNCETLSRNYLQAMLKECDRLKEIQISYTIQQERNK
jgi:hypothetical protein